jgi:hypothetical protein
VGPKRPAHVLSMSMIRVSGKLLRRFGRDTMRSNDLNCLTNLRGAMPEVIPAFSSEGRSPRT